MCPTERERQIILHFLPLSQGTIPRRFTLKIGFQVFQLSAILASHFAAKLLFWGLEADPKAV